MRMRQRIQKSGAAEPGTVLDGSKPKHRLTDITVKEVSIVDRAANKRNYLIVKHDEQKGAASVEKDVPVAQPTQPAPPAPPTAPAPTLRISPELKQKVLGILKSAQERIGVIAKVLEGSSETPGAPVPQELMTALSELASLFGPQPGVAPAGAVPAAKTETEKAGRKISGARLNMLNSVKATLDTLIADASEEAGEEEPSEEKKPAKKNEGEQPIGDPPDPSKAPKPGESTPEEPKPEEPKKEPAPGQPQEPAVPAVVRQEITEIKQALTGVADTFAKMMTVLDKQNERIASVTKNRGSSNQPDLDEEVRKSGEPKVSWDLDMAKPTKTYQ